MRIYDISVGIKNGMTVWPGDQAVEVGWDARIADGAASNVSFIRMGAHVGTHIDLPLHFIENGKGTESLELQDLIGRVQVVEVGDDIDVIDAAYLENTLLWDAKRLLFKSRNSKAWSATEQSFDENYVALDASGAEWLVAKGCELVGIDGFSIARFEETEAPHKILLGADVLVIECLDLSEVEAGEYDLICLPLKLIDREAAPVRAILLAP